jgi:Ni,Fe-hydrogenase I large subunit
MQEFDTNYALMSTPTLAPLKEDFYQPKNLTQRDATLLTTIAKNSITNVELAISNVTQYLNDLKLYKECMIDAINVESETADIAIKYATQPTQQTHTLPGVITSPPAYDLEAIKTDNDRMESLKELSDKAQKQKDIYIKLVQEDYKEFASHFRKILYCDKTFDAFCESLNVKTSQFYRK